MKRINIAFFIVFIFIYTVLNYFLGVRGKKFFTKAFPVVDHKVYWVLFWIIAFSYVISRIGVKILPTKIHYFFTLLGSYWIACIVYLLMLIVVMDVIVFCSRILGFISKEGINDTRFIIGKGLFVIIVLIVILVYGTINAKRPIVNTYNIEINKVSDHSRSIHAVLISDIHLGDIIDNKRLEEMVSKINEIEPEIVFIAGDIIDSDINPFITNKMGETFKKLNPPLGVYAVLGNHDYYGGRIEEVVSNLEKCGINVLRDDYVNIDNRFYVIGREDIALEMTSHKKRKVLGEITGEIDKSLPLILLDHQPRNLNEAMEEGVDLQLSGHTHKGQFFPNHFITKIIFEIDYGILKKEDFHVVVSSGYGTWGPPIRVMNQSEIVELFIHFKTF
ncbi:MAG: metallophosphoesterase [Marinisporobacter sp.]|nr:metallophosphoesterase [Marinisporobacter sp.]